MQASRRVLLLVAAVWAVPGVVAGQAATDVRGAARPNVLFIAIDDLNDWVGVLGGHPQARTPHIDRLAARGVLFTNAHANAPLCSPSRESVFSGRLPTSTHVYTNARPTIHPRRQVTTLPEYFRQAGYYAAGAGKLFHHGGDVYPEAWDTYGPGIGYSGGPFTKAEMDTRKQNPTYAVDRSPNGPRAVLPLNRMPDDRRPWRNSGNTFDWGAVEVADTAFSDARVAAWAVEQLGKEHNRPFFLGVGFFRPHQPLFAPPRYHAMYPPEDVVLPDVRPGDLDDVPPVGKLFALQPYTAGTHATVLEHEQWRHAVSAYLASVTFVDDLVGQVIAALDASPYAGNTVVVLWSDHGYHLGQKRHWGKWAGWQAATRVPLVVVPAQVAFPDGFEPGRHAGAPVSLIDLYPTLVDLCGLTSVPELDGESLVPLLSDPDVPRTRPAVTTFGRGNHAVRDGRWTYIRYFDGAEELYDREADPGEHRNLAALPQHEPTVDSLAVWMPADLETAHFVRMGTWKAVVPRDAYPPLLFDLAAGGGIGEQRDVAAEHPDVLARVMDYLRTNDVATRHVVIE